MSSVFQLKKYLSLDIKDKCSYLWEHYCNRKRTDEYEPNWILKPYDLARMYSLGQQINDEDIFLLENLLKSHAEPNGAEVPVKRGFPKEGTRLMHDGWKAGSSSWLFMGRKFSKTSQHSHYVIISRTLSDNYYNLLDSPTAPQTLFCAYSLLEEKLIGPAIFYDDLILEITKALNEN